VSEWWRITFVKRMPPRAELLAVTELPYNMALAAWLAAARAAVNVMNSVVAILSLFLIFIAFCIWIESER